MIHNIQSSSSSDRGISGNSTVPPQYGVGVVSGVASVVGSGVIVGSAGGVFSDSADSVGSGVESSPQSSSISGSSPFSGPAGAGTGESVGFGASVTGTGSAVIATAVGSGTGAVVSPLQLQPPVQASSNSDNTIQIFFFIFYSSINPTDFSLSTTLWTASNAVACVTFSNSARI